MSCRCSTVNGTRCTRAAIEGSSYCYQHQNCAQEADGSEYLVEASDVIRSALQTLNKEVKSITSERNFYYRKLVRISAFADTLRPKEREKLQKILSSQK